VTQVRGGIKRIVLPPWALPRDVVARSRARTEVLGAVVLLNPDRIGKNAIADRRRSPLIVQHCEAAVPFDVRACYGICLLRMLCVPDVPLVDLPVPKVVGASSAC